MTVRKKYISPLGHNSFDSQTGYNRCYGTALFCMACKGGHREALDFYPHCFNGGHIFTWVLPLLFPGAVLTPVSIVAGIGTAIAVGMIPEFVQFYRFKEIVIIWWARTTLLHGEHYTDPFDKASRVRHRRSQHYLHAHIPPGMLLVLISNLAVYWCNESAKTQDWLQCDRRCRQPHY